MEPGRLHSAWGPGSRAWGWFSSCAGSKQGGVKGSGPPEVSPGQRGRHPRVCHSTARAPWPWLALLESWVTFHSSLYLQHAAPCQQRPRRSSRMFVQWKPPHLSPHSRPSCPRKVLCPLQRPCPEEDPDEPSEAQGQTPCGAVRTRAAVRRRWRCTPGCLQTPRLPPSHPTATICFCATSPLRTEYQRAQTRSYCLLPTASVFSGALSTQGTFTEK